MQSGSASWHYSETGSGKPLILLHGIGMSHAAWNAVTPYLQSTRRVIAFDIAGFGQTEPLPSGTLPTVSNLVDALCRSLRASGLETPIDMVGNSLGGCMALEAARRGLARTVVAISPIGLWKDGPPPHVRHVFGGLRRFATRSPALLKLPLRKAFSRELALAVPLSVGSRRMPVSDAFGDRDWILTKRSRDCHALPAHTQWLIKRGWGHVPMWADPIGVSELILNGGKGRR
jgi:pimeloyl-ACP methyl ester carboxylesterase